MSSLTLALTLAVRLTDSLRDTQFHAHNSTINEIWTSAATPWSIATCSSDELVKFWDLRASSRLPAMAIPVGHEVWSLAVGNDDTLLSVGTDVKAHFFDMRTGTKVRSSC